MMCHESQRYLDGPKLVLGIFYICAVSETEALQLKSSSLQRVDDYEDCSVQSRLKADFYVVSTELDDYGSLFLCNREAEKLLIFTSSLPRLDDYEIVLLQSRLKAFDFYVVSTRVDDCERLFCAKSRLKADFASMLYRR
ncbi:hypothetical protein CEXT_759261 [Caerostris extrusa]|uniref:MutS-like protein n=1 Tax=Caerostris extrusa TaxID=172846 RepID=A0AAV4P0T9_CAEEX|nr:hypothetical protein CEXT_759261 [Caerostris extrusa]